MVWAPICRWTSRLQFRAYESRVWTSNAERVLPVGGAPASTRGRGDRPSERRSVVEKLVVSAVARRKGGFWAFDEDVPPTPQFQNRPSPPRRTVRPSPLASQANPRRGPR